MLQAKKKPRQWIPARIARRLSDIVLPDPTRVRVHPPPCIKLVEQPRKRGTKGTGIESGTDTHRNGLYFYLSPAHGWCLAVVVVIRLQMVDMNRTLTKQHTGYHRLIFFGRRLKYLSLSLSKAPLKMVVILIDLCR